MRIAVTGHRGLTGRTADLINAALRERLADLADGQALTGVTCLADGADTMFADAVLEHGGAIEVVIPAQQYREGLPDEALADYDRLLAAAVDVQRLDFVESNSDAHMAASLAMLDGADHLIAVWDGQPPRGPGGTADVVDAARDQAIPVTIVWPDGAQRG